MFQILPFKEPRLHLPWFDGMCPSFHTLQNVQNLVSGQYDWLLRHFDINIQASNSYGHITHVAIVSHRFASANRQG
jgi:hypothetical protein